MFDPFQKSVLTGTLFFRDAVAPAELPKGKKLMSVCGVIVVPDDFPVEGEHQAVIQGQLLGGQVYCKFNAPGVLLDEVAHWSFDRIMCAPIWRA